MPRPVSVGGGSSSCLPYLEVGVATNGDYWIREVESSCVASLCLSNHLDKSDPVYGQSLSCKWGVVVTVFHPFAETTKGDLTIDEEGEKDDVDVDVDRVANIV